MHVKIQNHSLPRVFFNYPITMYRILHSRACGAASRGDFAGYPQAYRDRHVAAQSVCEKGHIRSCYKALCR